VASTHSRPGASRATPRTGFDFDCVVVTEVSRHFGRRRALTRVSLTCRAGEIVGLLGPNGAGKSTLLSILATLAAPSSGEVRYGTATAREAGPSIRARLGCLGHDLYLYPELTARENLTFFANLYRIPDPQPHVVRALTVAGLTERADDLVGGFSRGMRQRLALERALLHGPRLVLLDEPFTGLDDGSVEALVGRLRTLRAEGAIVVLTTHDLDVIDGLVDRELILRDGRLVAVGETAGAGALRDRYRAALAKPAEPV
jgi:heme ABC exporter ATP-binding subunit CcmA